MSAPILPPAWEALQPLLDAALDLPRDQRPAYLEAACNGDVALRAELTHLLTLCERHDVLIDRPALERFPSLLSHRPDLPAALVAGRFRILREVGHGGMATVYLARDERHAREVALKLLRPELAAWLGPALFLAEIRTTAKLQHPNILPLFDSGEVDGIPYFIMPYVEGESLRQKLSRDGPLAMPEALGILRDTADALACAHRHGVVHRDIKPENVMLSGGRALVTDFGIARAGSGAIAPEGPAPGIRLGTPAYMAPEQTAGDPRADHRVDIYAFGVLAHEVLTGKTPFRQSFDGDTRADGPAEAAGPDRLDATLPPALVALVTKCLETSPGDRWQSAEELIAALEVLPVAGGGLPHEGASPRAAGWGGAAQRRSTGRRIAVLVGAAALTAGGTCYLVTRQRPMNPSLVVVAPLQNRTGTADIDSLGGELAERITQELGAQGVTTPVPSVRVREVLRRSPGDAAMTGQRLSRAAGAGLLVAGTIYQQGDTLEYRAEVLRMPGGELLGAIRPVRSTDRRDGASLLADRLAVLIAAHAEWGDEVRWGIDYDLPDRLAAYQAFSEALTIGARSFDEFRLLQAGLPKEAVTLLDRADSIAPTWLTAQAYRSDDTTRVKAMLSDPALLPGSREQLRVQLAQARGAWEEAYQLARRRFELAPNTHALLLARLAYRTERYDEVLALEAAQGAASFWSALARRSCEWPLLASFALHALGRHREELEWTRNWRARFPESELLGITAEIMAQAGLRDAEAVERLLEEAAALRPATASVRVSADRAAMAAKELRAHGLPDAARRVVGQAVVRAQRDLASGDSSIGDLESLGELMEVAGDHESGARIATEMLRRATPVSEWRRTALTRLGRAAAALSDTAAAHRALAELEGSRNDSPTVLGIPYQSALIRLTLGDTAGALRKLRQARRDGDAMVWMHVGWHRDALLVQSTSIPAVRAMLRARTRETSWPSARP